MPTTSPGGPPSPRRRQREAANRYGVTPSILACLNGNSQAIERLLKAGANVNSPSGEGETPLMTIARAGNIEPRTVLLDHGANIDAREELAWADRADVGRR